MSIDRCVKCGWFVDTDMYPEAYDYNEDENCHCESCNDKLIEAAWQREQDANMADPPIAPNPYPLSVRGQ